MRKKTNFLLISLLIFLSINCQTGSGQTSPNLVWTIKVGDNRTFTITKAYESYLETPTQKNVSAYSNVGWVNITKEAGLTFNVKVINIPNINKSTIYLQLTFEGDIKVNTTSYSETWGAFGHQTVDNQSFWKEECSKLDTWTLKGETRIKNEESKTETKEIIVQERWNWKTGWIEYVYGKEVLNGKLIAEWEMCSTGNCPSELIEEGGVPIILWALCMCIVVRNQKKKKVSF